MSQKLLYERGEFVIPVSRYYYEMKIIRARRDGLRRQADATEVISIS